MPSLDQAGFVEKCREHVVAGDFFALLNYCDGHRDAMQSLTSQERATIIRASAHRNAVRPSRMGVRVLFAHDDATPPETAQKWANEAFEHQNYFMQRALLFHGVDLEPARKAYEARELPEEDMERTRTAYEKLKAHTGIGLEDMPVESHTNIESLRHALGELNAEESAFLQRVRWQYDNGGFHLFHESSRGSGSNIGFRNQIAKSSMLHSSDELERMKAAKQLELVGLTEIPGSFTYDVDRDVIGNTDFVFTNLSMGDALGYDGYSLTTVFSPVITLPLNSFYISKGWLDLAEEGEVDRKKAEAHYGAEKLRECEQGDLDALDMDYDHAVRSFRKPGTFDSDAARKTIFFGHDIPEGMALRTILEMRKAQEPGAVEWKKDLRYGNDVAADAELLNKLANGGELLTPNRLKLNVLNSEIKLEL